MKTFLERLNKEWLFWDGGMGTLLQEMGLRGGELPETWNLTRPEAILKIQSDYLRAGSDVITTNTFGANRLKYPDDLEEVVTAAVNLAKRAREEAGRPDAFVALDLGPTGRLLSPLGELDFEDAVSIFAETVKIGVNTGADLIIIETMSDTYEEKAAVLAAKENSKLPVVATNVYDENGKLLTGGGVEPTVALLEGLGVDALGINCGTGPKNMLPVVERLVKAASVPVLVSPNAGLPEWRTAGPFTI